MANRPLVRPYIDLLSWAGGSGNLPLDFHENNWLVVEPILGISIEYKFLQQTEPPNKQKLFDPRSNVNFSQWKLVFFRGMWCT